MRRSSCKVHSLFSLLGAAACWATTVTAWPSVPFISSVPHIWTNLNLAPLSQDSELDYDAHQFAVSKGYPFEQHRVVTEDGYILTLHRIKHGSTETQNEHGCKNSTSNKRKPVAFLQHGLLASSDDWVLNSKNQSLGFILADAGYDVWMGNVRGNKYSRMHNKINPTNAMYWDFSFHEIAQHDLPAMLDYVAAKTGQESIYYIGHSQGTLIGFIGFSAKPGWAQRRVRQFHALAPVAYLKTITSGVRYLAPFSRVIGGMLSFSHLNEFGPHNSLVQVLADRGCTGLVEKALCTQIIFVVAGFDGKNVNETRLPVYVAHSPAGTSTKNMLHFAQNIYNKRLQQFDYGSVGNLQRYGKPTPPLYSISQLSVPTALYWGDKDCLADPEDVALLRKEIKSAVFAEHEISNTDHLDFVWGTNAESEIYPLLLEHLMQDQRSKKDNVSFI